MAFPIDNSAGKGFAQMAMSTAVSESTRSGYLFVLSRPLKRFSVSSILVQSTAADLVLRGSPSTATDAPMGTILSYTCSTSTDGEVQWTTGNFPVKQLRLDVDAVSSSGSITAHVAGD